MTLRSASQHLVLGLFLVTLAGCNNIKNFGNIDLSTMAPQEKARHLVEGARDALISIAEDEQIGSIFLKNYRDPNVSAIILTPNLLKGGLFIGGAGGSGILLARASNGEWSYPTFVRQGSGSFGLQIGFESAKVASLITSVDQLETMLNGSPIVGGSANGAIVDEGSGFDYSGGLDVSSALKSYAVSRGAYIGVDVKLGGLWIDAELNEAFYGDPYATPQSIVLEARQKNALADPLRNSLMQYHSSRY